MSELSLSGPAGPDPADQPNAGASGPQAGSQQRYSRRRTSVPTVVECLGQLASLPGLVALRMLTPAQSNAIRASLNDILQHHERAKSSHQRSAIADADILDLMGRDPRILNMLEPLLTDEQIAMFAQQTKGRDGGTA
jgi:hypothetical protein